MADLLSIDDSMTVADIATQWLHIYSATLLLDDVIDSPDKSLQSLQVIAAALLLERGVSAFIGSARSPSALRPRLDAAFTDTAAAAIDELQFHRDKVTSFSVAGIRALGNKVALFRVCAHALMDRVEQSDKLHDWLEPTLDSLTCSIQLLDDIVDWEEDYSIGNVTLPLTLCHQRSMLGKERRNRTELLARLVISGALEDSLASATNALRSTLALISNGRYCGLGRARLYIAALIEAACHAASVVRAARVHLTNSGARDALCTIDAVQRAPLREVERALAILAQGS